MDRSWNDSVLRVMLDKLSKSELIEDMIATINSICKEDKHLKAITHFVTTQCQVVELSRLSGKQLKMELDKYEEPHKTELKKELEKRKIYG
jgi:hypothetical protein